MNYEELRGIVYKAIAENDGVQAAGAATDTAIRAVIEALAQEAEAEPFMDFTGDWERSSSEGFADWLRAHLPDPKDERDG